MIANHASWKCLDGCFFETGNYIVLHQAQWYAEDFWNKARRSPEPEYKFTFSIPFDVYTVKFFWNTITLLMGNNNQHYNICINIHQWLVHLKMKICWKYTHPQAIQDVDEFVSSSEQICRNLKNHHNNPQVISTWSHCNLWLICTNSYNFTRMVCEKSYIFYEVANSYERLPLNLPLTEIVQNHTS